MSGLTPQQKQRIRQQKQKAEREAGLVKITDPADPNFGREVASNAPYHGTRSIYNHWLCRCVECTDANTAYAQQNAA